jgi:fructokinase
METEFYGFGEMLWDCLPSGRHAGGAPFNVAAHLAQLGVSAGMISAVGQDESGAELLSVARDKRVQTEHVGHARPGLPTGTVLAAIDAAGNATYRIVEPVAWDEIAVSATTEEAVGRSRALFFGSLAARSSFNRSQLQRLLALPGPTKFFDVNLRAPFDDLHRVLELARRADVLKLNHDEVNRIAGFLGNSTVVEHSRLTSIAEIAAGCAAIATATGTSTLCVTMGGDGAMLWERGGAIHVAAPRVTVRDTVGAGDAFMAAMMIGMTRGGNPSTVLRTACEVGAFVASHDGATPMFPRDKAAAWITSLQP